LPIIYLRDDYRRIGAPACRGRTGRHFGIPWRPRSLGDRAQRALGGNLIAAVHRRAVACRRITYVCALPYAGSPPWLNTGYDRAAAVIGGLDQGIAPKRSGTSRWEGCGGGIGLFSVQTQAWFWWITLIIPAERGRRVLATREITTASVRDVLFALFSYGAPIGRNERGRCRGLYGEILYDGAGLVAV